MSYERPPHEQASLLDFMINLLWQLHDERSDLSLMDTILVLQKTFEDLLDENNLVREGLER